MPLRWTVPLSPDNSQVGSTKCVDVHFQQRRRITPPDVWATSNTQVVAARILCPTSLPIVPSTLFSKRILTCAPVAEIFAVCACSMPSQPLIDFNERDSIPVYQRKAFCENGALPQARARVILYKIEGPCSVSHFLALPLTVQSCLYIGEKISRAKPYFIGGSGQR